jgi:hypothetical protein
MVEAVETKSASAPVADTVRFGEVAAPGSAVMTQRAGGDGAAVIANIDVVAPAAAAAAAIDPEADRPTVTARTTAAAARPVLQQVIGTVPPVGPSGTMIDARAMADAMARAATAVPVAAKTLMSNEARAVAPVETTLLAAGNEAVRKVVEEAKADATATATAVVPVRRGLPLVPIAIAVLGVCAFAGAYLASKQTVRGEAPVSSAGARASAGAGASASAGPSASAAPVVPPTVGSYRTIAPPRPRPTTTSLLDTDILR